MRGYPDKIPLNAVEREPVETRVLNPNASEASYKPKQRSCRKTKLIFLFSFFSGGFCRGDFILEPFSLYTEMDSCLYMSMYTCENVFNTQVQLVSFSYIQKQFNKSS